MSHPREPDISSCSTCGAPLDWFRTNANKWTPLDAGTKRPHWETCPDAEVHRRQKPKPPQPPFFDFFDQ